VGTPANIVNVPVYGQKTSSQVQGQADAPSLEVTVNYIAEDMTAIHALIGQTVIFRFMMAASAVTPDEGAAATLAVENTEFYFQGKIEAILVNPAFDRLHNCNRYSVYSVRFLRSSDFGCCLKQLGGSSGGSLFLRNNYGQTIQ